MNDLCRPVSDYITYACAPDLAKMSTPAPPLSRTWAPLSFEAPLRAHGHPAITMFYLRIPTAYAWKSTTCLVPGSSLKARRSIPAKATGEQHNSARTEASKHPPG